ncbi:SDR family NAD(P)-dependent oxidoreductase [Siccirubricoccus sp. G192]|uniref:SDR family NAD(P)-dependent oxidoreductase n=1 Tax=Siccirubricoccus sp. G192 TaxID=2849651 RepID=UPI0028119789|nr:SDR family NAD(P)-dependent oxidoreductase [Siccirubricoccus sp. G192]
MTPSDDQRAQPGGLNRPAQTGAPLEGSVALVTGASRGIGAAVAVELARLGAHCVLVARTQGGLEETDDAIRSLGRQATLLPLDFAKAAEKLDMLGPSIVERFGRLDILVHAAGVLSKLTPAAHIMPNDWQEAVAVNLSACWHLIRTCDPPLRAAPAGRAVVLTDARVAEPHAYWGLYSAGKAGQENLVRAWAEEVARTPLRVNLFDPGPVNTRLRRAAMPGEDPASLPQPRDVAPAIAALCLPGEARNGAVLRAGQHVGQHGAA